jgi:hypothetical protein
VAYFTILSAYKLYSADSIGELKSDRRKFSKLPVKTSDIPVEIRTIPFPNASLERYRYAKPNGIKSMLYFVKYRSIDSTAEMRHKQRGDIVKSLKTYPYGKQRNQGSEIKK